MKRKNLLLVEDEPVIALFEIIRLENDGYEVQYAKTGETALEIVNKAKIDLILMDIDLGRGMNGLETAGRIRQKYNMPILFLTSYEYCELKEQIENIENSAFLSDKSLPDESIQCIKNFLSSKK